jgi:hypothetical protein
MIRVDAPLNVWLIMNDGRLSAPKYLDPVAGGGAVATRGPLHLMARHGAWMPGPTPIARPVPLTVCALRSLHVIPQSAPVLEGDEETKLATIPVSLTATSRRQVQVEWRGVDALSTATTGVDYVAPSHGTITFAPGQRTSEVVLRVRGDTLKEPNERLTLSFENPTNAEVAGFGVANLVILDDD